MWLLFIWKETEQSDYNRLVEIGIRIPKMLDIDIEKEIIKEYIDESIIYDLVKNNTMKDVYLTQMQEMAMLVYETKLNIYYFPTNFVIQNELIYYIDYECGIILV